MSKSLANRKQLANRNYHFYDISVNRPLYRARRGRIVGLAYHVKRAYRCRNRFDLLDIQLFEIIESRG
jgi:hypothetical protein